MKKKSQEDDVLKLYGGLKEEMRELQGKLDALEPEVMAVLDERKVDTLIETFGTFSKVYRKTWKYSGEYENRAEQYDVILKGLREDEQKSGEAKFTEKVGLSYRRYEPKA